MFSTYLLNTCLNDANDGPGVLRAFMGASAYGFGDLVYVTDTSESANYPGGHVGFETRLTAPMADSYVTLSVMYTVYGTVDGIRLPYLGINVRSASIGSAAGILQRKFTSGDEDVAAGTILARALGYDDYVVMDSVYTNAAGLQPTTVSVQGEVTSFTQIWFNTFVTDQISENRIVSRAEQLASVDNNTGMACILSSNTDDSIPLFLDQSVRESDNQNFNGLTAAIQDHILDALDALNAFEPLNIEDRLSSMSSDIDEALSMIDGVDEFKTATLNVINDLNISGAKFGDIAKHANDLSALSGYVPRP